MVKETQEMPTQMIESKIKEAAEAQATCALELFAAMKNELEALA